MLEKEPFITITGFHHYYGIKPFAIDRVVILEKERDNKDDSNAIAVIMPILGKVGYVANSPHTIAGGCLSAREIYNSFPQQCAAFVRFTTQKKVIARIFPDKKLLVHIEISFQENDESKIIVPFAKTTKEESPLQ